MARANRPSVLQVISSALGTLAGFILIILLGMTVADVISRNFFGTSILGMIEISTLLLTAVAFFGLAQAESDGRHVSVGLLEERLPFGARLVLAWTRILILLFLGGVMVWGMSDAVLSAIMRAESTNDVLALPTWPAKIAILLSFAVFVLIAICRDLIRVKNNQKAVEYTYDNV